jgi:AcrR family transcriptional regulator
LSTDYENRNLSDVKDITEPIPLPVSRGPVEHERREQIVAAACEHFRAHGYGKTSVAELAKAIGVSSAYVYRFFDSKQSIGEAACSKTLARIAQSLFDLENEPWTPSEKLRRFYGVLLESGYELFMEQRKVHELVAGAVSQDWVAVANHRKAIRAVLQRIVVEGRKRGEFERKTPLDEVVLALGQAALPFAHPVLLAQRELQELRTSAAAVAGLVLRSLAP